MSDEVNVQISKELIKPVIEAKIQAAIISELRNIDDLIPKFVEAALVRYKVNEKGEQDKYSSYNKYSFIEAMCQRTIQQAAKDAFAEFIQERQPQIKAEFMKILQTQKHQKAVVKAMVDGLVGCVEKSWRFVFDAKFETMRD